MSDVAIKDTVPLEGWTYENAQRLSENIQCHIEVLCHPPMRLEDCDDLHRMIMTSIREWSEENTSEAVEEAIFEAKKLLKWGSP